MVKGNKQGQDFAPSPLSEGGFHLPCTTTASTAPLPSAQGGGGAPFGGAILAQLLILLAVAVLWAFSAGLWLHQKQPIPLKKHSRRAISLFRKGLDFLERQLRNRSLSVPVDVF